MSRAALVLTGALLASIVAVSATGPSSTLAPARAASFDDLAKQAYRILKANQAGTNWWKLLFKPAMTQNNQLKLFGP